MLEDEQMTLIAHLGELRKRIFWVLIVLVLGMIGGFVVAKPVLTFLKNDSPIPNVEWNVFGPWDALRVYMQVSFIISLIVVVPVALYHLWAFVKPGLRLEERKATLRYIPFTVLLFLFGLAFAYYAVIPMAFKFTTSLTKSLELKETYGISQYFSFIFNIILPISLVFELPMIMMFLTRLRIVNPIRLRKLRRYAYLLLTVLSAIITPPDAISAILVAVPLFILYELSVFLSKMIYRKQLAEDNLWEADYGKK